MVLLREISGWSVSAALLRKKAPDPLFSSASAFNVTNVKVRPSRSLWLAVIGPSRRRLTNFSVFLDGV